MTQPPDIFTEARGRLTIADAWRMLVLPGEPLPSCRSPVRDEKHNSFSIHADGTKWTDHGTGIGGDVIECISVATDLDHRGGRQWLIEKLNLDHAPTTAPRAAATSPQTGCMLCSARMVESTRDQTALAD